MKKVVYNIENSETHNMKLIVIALALLVASASADRSKRKEAMMECMKENGLDKDQLKSGRGQENPPKNVKCFSACMGIKLGTMSEDGTINVEKLNEIFGQKPGAKEAIAKCAAAVPKDDKCEVAYAFKWCLKQNGVSLNIP